jgi:S-ribosylhomocysteine lyase LuxS involved in autoinducer biosynthesis
MPTFVKPSRRATQLPLFHSPHEEPNWESMPREIQQQIEHLLARMLRDHAARHCGAQSQEDRDE